MKIQRIARELEIAETKKVKSNVLFAVLFIFSSVFLAFFCVFIFDYLTHFPPLLRLCLTIVILFIFAAFLPYRWRRLFVRSGDILKIAKEIEAKAEKIYSGGMNSLLVSSVEFATIPTIPGLTVFKQKTVEKAQMPDYSPLRIELADERLRKISLKTLPVFISLYLLWLIFSPNTFAVFWMRAAGINISYPTKTKIFNMDYPENSPQYEDVIIKIAVGGLVPSTGKAYVKFDGERQFSMPLLLEKSGKGDIFICKVLQPLKSFDFSVQIGDAETEKKRVNVITQPTVKEGRIKIFPPEYTGVAESESPIKDIEILEGSRTEIRITTDRPVTKAVCEIISQDRKTSEYPMQKDGQQEFSLKKIFSKEEKSYSIRLIDENGIENKKRVFYSVRVIPDKLPVINLERPADGYYYSPVSKMNWSLKATDDYGIDEITMYYKVLATGESGETKTLREGSLPIAKQNEKTTVSLTGTINLANLKVQAGTILSIQMQVKDRNPFRPANETGKSQTKNLNIVSPAELRDMINSELLLIGKVVEDIQTDMKKQIKIIDMKKTGERK